MVSGIIFYIKKIRLWINSHPEPKGEGSEPQGPDGARER